MKSIQKSFGLLFFVMIASYLAAKPALAGSCSASFHFSPNEIETIGGATKKNTPCVFGYTMVNMVSVTPVTRPKNGQLLKKSLGNFAYQPNPNFVGRDSFTVQVIWNINKKQSITYDIEVSP